MKKVLLFAAALVYAVSSFGQSDSEYFKSVKLDDKRKIKIQLPEGYDPMSDLKYPLVVVLDGDYLFEPVAGQINFQSYFDDMPQSIVVGIMHEDNRDFDGISDEITGLPMASGAQFFEFIGMELVPFLESQYNISKFRVAVGHNLMANFTNAFMFKEEPLFQAYVSLSPDFQGEMRDHTIDRLTNINKDIIFYMATAEFDEEKNKQDILDINSSLAEIENTNLTYYFDNFEGANHYSFVPKAITKAFDKIFDIYKPIREKELIEKVFPYEGTLDEYLVERYNKIEELFGVGKEIPEEEFEKIAYVAEKRDDAESFAKLGKLAKKKLPESNLSNYYLAVHAEKSGKAKKAMKYYESAMEQEETFLVDKDVLLAKVNDIKMAMEDIETDEIDEEHFYDEEDGGSED